MNSSVPRLLPDLAAGPAGKPAFMHRGRRLTYGALRAEVARLAQRLREDGLGSGDRALLLFPNCPEHVVALLAVASLGAIAAPVDPEVGPVRLQHILEVVEPKRILAGAEVTPSLEVELLRWALSGEEAPADEAGREVAVSGDVTPDTPALILFSSGSTGRPKGVVLTHAQLLWTARSLAETYRFRPGHREIVLCPFTHSDGWQRVAATLSVGGCVHPFEGILSVVGFLEDAAECRVQGFFAPPPFIRMLLRKDPTKVRRALATCEHIEVGSAPIAAEELRQLLDLLPHTAVFYHYGLTEVSRAFVLDARAHPDKLSTVGLPHRVEVQVRNPVQHRMAPGQPGEIFLRGPQQAAGYWRLPDKTQARFQDGWFRTGDFGMLDEDGYLVLLGREDDLITSAGYHFYPAEVEAQLGVVPGVKEYLIAGVPDPRGLLGQVPWAFVVPEDPETWKSRDFMAAARQRLPAYMLPRWVVPIPVVPLTPAHKPDRRRTVAQYGPTAGATSSPTAATPHCS